MGIFIELFFLKLCILVYFIFLSDRRARGNLPFLPFNGPERIGQKTSHRLRCPNRNQNLSLIIDMTCRGI